MTEEIFFFLGLLMAISASSVRSNHGRNFLLPVHDIGTTLTLKIVSDNATQVSIKGPEVDLLTDVPAKSVSIHNLTISTVGYSGAINISVQNTAVSVSASSDIWLYVFVHDGNSEVGGLTAIPVEHLSDDYRVATYNNAYDNFNFVTITAVEDNTVVSIMIITTNGAKCKSGNLTDGEIVVVTLNRNDVVGIICEFDITGSIIHSNSSIAVVSGHWIFLEQDLSLRIEMLIPVNSFGTEFVLPVSNSETIFRILPAEVPAMATIDSSSTVVPNHPGFIQVTLTKSKCLVVNSSSMVIVYSPTPYFGENFKMEMSTVPSTDRYQSAYIAEVPDYEDMFLGTMTTVFKRLGSGVCETFTSVINMSDPFHVDEFSHVPKPFGMILYEPQDMIPMLPVGMLFGINMCVSEPCMNNATCMAIVRDFVCLCEPGFNGTYCETNIDECASFPCLNGGACLDSINRFVCQCELGFNGTFCENNIDECARNPCENNASCIDGDNKFNCKCQPGFNGTLCENNIDDCSNNRCMNNGTCVDGINMFLCECEPGFRGKFCETNINECQTTTCMNNGTCVDGINMFLCECEPGFSGTLCETNIDECRNNTCMNNGTCVDGINNFLCECEPGFNGTLCETNKDECYSNPCLNNGSCVDGVNQFYCECEPGFSGLLCNIQLNSSDPTVTQPCGSNPCKNNATCLNEFRGFVCECTPGFNGELCEQNIDECSNNPCLNNATCVDEVAAFICKCQPGFTGIHCETVLEECPNNPCENNALCYTLTSDTTPLCACLPGFTGEMCEQDKDECHSNPCLNDGSCVDGVNNFVCECGSGFSGFLCDIQLNSPDPTVTQPCGSNPCKNNATCLNEFEGFVCECTPGFNGELCEQNIDECSNKPCMNNATCVDEVAAFICKCEPGFTGIHCETVLEECPNNPCENNALCYTLTSDTTPLCDCLPGFTGELCEQDIDECTSDPCGENQNCVNSPGDFSCECKPGFIQPDCVTSLSPSTIEPTVTEYTYPFTRVVSLHQSLFTISGDVITDVIPETDIRFSSTYSPLDPTQSLKCNSTCLCTRYGSNSVEYVDVEAIVDGIKGRLLLDKYKLLKTTSKYTSRPDERPTAKGIGSVGCMVIIGTVLVLVVPDLFYVLRLYNRPMSRVEYVMT